MRTDDPMESQDGQADQGPALSARQIWIRFLLYPAHTLPTAAAPVLVGAGLAARDGVFSPWPVLWAFLGSWLIHVGGVLADNDALLRRHPDVPEHPELLQAVASGVLDLDKLRLVARACIVIGASPALYLVAVGGPLVLVIGAVGVLASLGYAAAGTRYARFGLADPIFFVLFGIVAVVGIYYVQAAPALASTWASFAVLDALPPRAFLVGLPVGALVTNVLVIDDIRDRGFDAEKGWRTTAVRFGLAGSRLEYVALTAFAYAAPFAFWLWLPASAWVLLPLATLPVALSILHAVLTKHTTPDLLAMTPRASFLSLAYAGLLGAGLAA